MPTRCFAKCTSSRIWSALPCAIGPENVDDDLAAARFGDAEADPHEPLSQFVRQLTGRSPFLGEREPYGLDDLLDLAVDNIAGLSVQRVGLGLEFDKFRGIRHAGQPLLKPSDQLITRRLDREHAAEASHVQPPPGTLAR